VQIFKPTLDIRHDGDHIVSHSDMRILSSVVTSARALLDQVAPDTEVVGIDEGEFFDAELSQVCNILAD
jgi:thymidine kinase